MNGLSCLESKHDKAEKNLTVTIGWIGLLIGAPTRGHVQCGTLQSRRQWKWFPITREVPQLMCLVRLCKQGHVRAIPFVAWANREVSGKLGIEWGTCLLCWYYPENMSPNPTGKHGLFALVLNTFAPSGTVPACSFVICRSTNLKNIPPATKNWISHVPSWFLFSYLQEVVKLFCSLV